MDDISLAAELVREAGTLASEMLHQGLEVRYKTSLSDVVSAADHASEERSSPGSRKAGPMTDSWERKARVRSERAAPGTSIRSMARTTSSPASRTGVRPWVWSTLMGPCSGAVFYPDLDQLWLGGRDTPTTLNGEPVPSLLSQRLSEDLDRDLPTTRDIFRTSNA